MSFAFARVVAFALPGHLFKIKMKEYGISADDLGITGRKRVGKSTRKPVAPKYRNNTTGETWSGRGKPPKWMAGHDKSQYLIK